MSISTMTTIAYARRAPGVAAGPAAAPPVATAPEAGEVAAEPGAEPSAGVPVGLPAPPPPPTPAAPPTTTTAGIAGATGELPETQSGVSSALATITAYVPTEILVLYVAVLGALAQGAAGQLPAAAPLWANFLFFLVATPVVVWLVYAGKLKTAGVPMPFEIERWPSWEMFAATLAYVAWTLALPEGPFARLAWYNSAVAGVAVLAVSALIALLAPLVSGPLTP